MILIPIVLIIVYINILNKKINSGDDLKSLPMWGLAVGLTTSLIGLLIVYNVIGKTLDKRIEEAKGEKKKEEETEAVEVAKKGFMRNSLIGFGICVAAYVIIMVVLGQF